VVPQDKQQERERCRLIQGAYFSCWLLEEVCITSTEAAHARGWKPARAQSFLDLFSVVELYS
jgi:hypothetical protein